MLTHPNKVYYAAPSSAMRLMYVYTMEVVQGENRTSGLNMSVTLIPVHSSVNA